MIAIKTNNKKGYELLKIGGVLDCNYLSSKTRRGRVQQNGEICPTVTAETFETYRIERSTKTMELRIRKLTPKECGRLMGVDDKSIDKMLETNSNSQCYKQFGNSIVVDVLVAQFKNLGIAGVPRWQEKN